jgi:hypothetical protein
VQPFVVTDEFVVETEAGHEPVLLGPSGLTLRYWAVYDFTVSGGASVCNRGAAGGRGTLQPTEIQWKCENRVPNIRTNRIGEDFPWCFGIAGDQGGAEAGVIRIPIGVPPHMLNQCNQCMQSLG